MKDRIETPMKSPNNPPQFEMKSVIPNSSDLRNPRNLSDSKWMVSSVTSSLKNSPLNFKTNEYQVKPAFKNRHIQIRLKNIKFVIYRMTRWQAVAVFCEWSFCNDPSTFNFS